MKRITLEELLYPLNFKQLRQLCKKHYVQAGKSKAITRDRLCSSWDIQIEAKYEGNGKWSLCIVPSINHILVEESGRIGDEIAKMLLRKTSYFDVLPVAEWPSSIIDPISPMKRKSPSRR